MIPTEDTGAIYINVATAPGSTLNETKQVMDQIEKCIRDIPQIEIFAKIAGYGMLSGQGATNGIFLCKTQALGMNVKGKEIISTPSLWTSTGARQVSSLPI